MIAVHQVPRIQIHKNVDNESIENGITKNYSNYQPEPENKQIAENQYAGSRFSLKSKQVELPVSLIKNLFIKIS